VPFSELPLSVLVILFLAVFVLVGIYPALERAATKLRKLVHITAQSKKPVAALLDDLHAELFAQQPTTGPLNDFEIFVLRRLAQARGKALTRKQVNSTLLFSKKTIHKTLRSLNRRGLVHVKMSLLLQQRFALSEAGRRYAIEQGYIVHVHEDKNKTFWGWIKMSH
jgi:uncharacterized membrane protein